MKFQFPKLMLLSLLAFSFVFVACDNDDEEKTPEEQIVGTWKATQQFVKNGSAAEVEITDSVEACDLDDLTTFESNKTYTIDEGATKCDTSSPQVVDNGTWALIDSDSKLVMDSNDSTENDTATIISLTDSRIEISLNIGTESEPSILRVISEKQ